jgi:hypothetical protein
VSIGKRDLGRNQFVAAVLGAADFFSAGASANDRMRRTNCQRWSSVMRLLKAGIGFLPWLIW